MHCQALSTARPAVLGARRSCGAGLASVTLPQGRSRLPRSRTAVQVKAAAAAAADDSRGGGGGNSLADDPVIGPARKVMEGQMMERMEELQRRLLLAERALQVRLGRLVRAHFPRRQQQQGSAESRRAACCTPRQHNIHRSKMALQLAKST